jgi:poly(3-hydroxybutyrate) depolymerase
MMLYRTYQASDDLLAPFRLFARIFCTGEVPVAPLLGFAAGDFFAAMEMLTRYRLSHVRPAFGIEEVVSGGRRVAVREETALDLPFGRLIRFAKPGEPRQPKILVVAPLSGHFSTLLRGTVEVLLRDHDIFITDWANARDVPQQAGRFGIEEYVDYIIAFLEALGPGGNVLAVCQPCVQTLIAVALMSAAGNPATPRTMTLMAGPIDVRESPTEVNALACAKSLAWFEQNVITTVPCRYKGGGRKVYPGFMQLLGFLAMNMPRHVRQHRKLYRHLAHNEVAEARRIKEFYDEYFAVLDMTAEFYIETIDRIFQKAELAHGKFRYRGELVEPRAIRRTALLTIEGGRDDICALGQTSMAHDLCRSLRPHLKRHHLQANVGHYGVFSGSRWEREIYPVVRNMILAME